MKAGSTGFGARRLGTAALAPRAPCLRGINPQSLSFPPVPWGDVTELTRAAEASMR